MLIPKVSKLQEEIVRPGRSNELSLRDLLQFKQFLSQESEFMFDNLIGIQKKRIDGRNYRRAVHELSRPHPLNSLDESEPPSSVVRTTVLKFADNAKERTVGLWPPETTSIIDTTKPPGSTDREVKTRQHESSSKIYYGEFRARRAALLKAESSPQDEVASLTETDLVVL